MLYTFERGPLTVRTDDGTVATDHHPNGAGVASSSRRFCFYGIPSVPSMFMCRERSLSFLQKIFTIG